VLDILDIVLTIHGLPLNSVVALILREEKLEVGFRILNIADLVVFVDEIT